MAEGAGHARAIGFARWTSASPSGGNRYDDALARELRRLGIEVREHAVEGPWPRPSAEDRARFAQLLEVEDEWLVGNIVASAAPAEIGRALQGRRRVTMIVHWFPADHEGLDQAARAELAEGEAKAVRAASAVVATSEWGAREIARRYGRDDAVAAPPGAEAAPISPGALGNDGAPGLLWLGRIDRSKDPMTFVAALGLLRDRPWTAEIVGPEAADAELAVTLRERISALGLGDRVRVAGSLEGDELEAAWARADLLVHTSRLETYGMVVAEALAHGVPSIVAEGTGAVEAQRGVGGRFPPGEAAALAAELGAWLEDAALREAWRARALGARERLEGWDETARRVVDALEAAAAR